MPDRNSQFYKLYYQNVRGLCSKLNTFYVNVCDLSYDVIFLTETWLVESVRDSEFFPEYYSVVRSDRNCAVVGRGRGGGVLVAFAPNIHYSVVDVSSLSLLAPLIDLVLCRCYFNHITIFLGII